MTGSELPLLTALSERVLVADGAMGTMLQEADLSLDDFEQLEGCNEILNVTRPDVIRSIHAAYYDAGSDLVETNTFGANLSNLSEYDIPERIEELAFAGAVLAREVADGYTDRPRFVLGSVGPGTKLPSLGHAPYALLRDTYLQQMVGLINGGVDAIMIETQQDILLAKAAIIAAKRAMTQLDKRVALFCHVTVEQTGTMLLGTEIGAALTALEPLGIDLIGLNCATGPAEMSEHLRHLAANARIRLGVMPNAGLPELGPNGAVYPLQPDDLATALSGFVTNYGTQMVGGCCGTTPEHISRVAEAVRDLTPAVRDPKPEPSVASLYQSVPLRQELTYLAIGERTNANGSKAFKAAMLEDRIDDCIEIARAQTRDGSHVLDLCIDYVGRDGVADMRALTSKLATASTLPLVLDSTDINVIEAGLEHLGGRAIINSVNYEDGDGPESRIAQLMPIVREHGAAVVALTIDEEGQARTAEWKVRVATRLIEDLTTNWGMAISDIIVDALTFPISTGQDETRRDALETIDAIREIKRLYPEVNTTLGLSNVSFGLNPAARQVLNSVFLHEAVEAGLDSAIVHSARILPMSKIGDEQRKVALDMVYDRRRGEDDEGGKYDPLSTFLQLFEGVDAASARETRAQELAGLPLEERLQRRIVDGERKGLEADLDEGMSIKSPLEIVNQTLLAGMKTVGELFGAGEMQLPFVLQSAEVMKAAVAYLEPHMEATDEDGKGKIVLATVKGDVHDIGKNLVDIILSNNGYDVVNIGIKQPINAIIDAAEEHSADVIGMSGLLVKSTVIMKDNLAEMNSRGVAAKWPVLLGGAALTRAYVERDLGEMYQGDVRYARDAFEGLRLMDAIVEAKRSGKTVTMSPEEQAKADERKARHDRSARIASERKAKQEAEDALLDAQPARSDVAVDVDVPTPPFIGNRVVKGIALAEYSKLLDERATFFGQWGLRGAKKGSDGPSYEELVETEGRPRLRYWLERFQTDNVLEAAVSYGYFPCVSEGNDLLILDEDGGARCRFPFPRQRRERRLCLSDFFRAKDSGQTDVVAFQIVTMGNRISEYANELFQANSYRDYLEVHGLSVQLTEAMAEFWHKRVREELGIAAGDPDSSNPAEVAKYFDLAYRGARYSFGYPACPNVEDQDKIMDLLEPGKIGVTLSEESQLHPEQSTSAIVLHHPEAIYFNAR